MKKYISLLLVLTMCLSLCACGGGSTYTVTKSSGGGESMTADDFIDLHENNQLKYSKEYTGCSISGSGEITKIEQGPRSGFYYYTNEYSYYTITINDEICILSLESMLPACEVGDTVYFNAPVQTVYMGYIYLFNQNEKTPSITE